MATQTRQLIRMDGGAFEASFDYDDATLRILAVRAANTGERPYTIQAYASANDRTYSFTMQPGDSVEQPVPQTVVNRLQLSVTARGQLVGVNWSVV